MIKEVTKNLQSTPTCTRSPLRESMQTGLNVTKGAAAENSSPSAMATALAASNSTTVSLTDSSHAGYINGEISVESKALKLTFKRNKAPSDTTSIPSPSPKQDDVVKSDSQAGGVPIMMHSDSAHRHVAVNGKMLPSTSSSSSLSHSTHGEQTRTTTKRTSNNSSSANKRPKSASKRERSSSGKGNASLPMNSGSSTLVNGRPSSTTERNHDPYQFTVKKEEETILPPKKLRLDSSLNRLPDRSETYKDQATNTRNQGTTVDADLLGPCEPGTQINLDGYVCLETVTGMLMVSVVWRGRTYLGTLIDSSTHGFSPPIPPSYVYASQRYCSGIDGGGNSSSNNGNGRNQRGRGKRRCGFAPTTGARHSRKGRRNARGSPVTVTSSASATTQGINAGDDSNEESQSRGESPASENPLDDEEAIMRYQCPQTGCHKRFKDVKAMKFHHDECHTKKTSDPASDSEGREKRSKVVKSTNKNKKHTANNSKVSNSQPSVVKTEPLTPVEIRSAKGTPDTANVKNESNSSDIPPSYFKTPVNNGLSSPPLLSCSPTSPSAAPLPASPANGLMKHSGGNGSSCSPETLTLPLHASSHQMKQSPASNTQQQMPPSQQHELPVRIPTSANLLVRVGVTSTAGGPSISSSTISSVNSATPSAPRTVNAVTVPVTTIPVMKPSTVASSSVSPASISGGKKVNSKELKNNGGNGKSSNSRSHASGTVSANTVTVPSVSSPLTPSCPPSGSCSTTLKPIQPKPLVPPVASTNSGGAKTPTPVNASGTLDPSAKRTSANISRKRKKSSGMSADTGKRQSVSSGNVRSSQGKPVQGGKRSSGTSGSACSEGSTNAQGDRASPAYSDISDDNESPIPILEKEGDVKLLSDTTGGCDEVGKASEQTSGSGGFYNTPPSLVPFSVYSADQSSLPAGNLGNAGVRALNMSGGAPRPTSLTKKASSPVETASSTVNPTAKANTPVIPGTAPLPVSTNQSNKKIDSNRVKADFGLSGGSDNTTTAVSVASILGTTTDVIEKSESSKIQVPSRNDLTSHTIDDQLRVKKSVEPPNLTKISTPTPLTSLTLPSSTSTATTPTSSMQSNTSQGTVAKPTPLNPLSPSRSSDLPASTPAVVTPGALVGGPRASELYSSRPDHLPTPPSFHPAAPGGPFGPSAQFAAHLSSPGALGPQPPFPPFPSDAIMRFVHPAGPHPPGHPFSGYPYPAEPFFPSPPVSSAPQPHKIHELVEKGVVAATTTATSNAPGVPTLCTSTSTTASSVANKPPVSVDTATPMDLQTAKSFADMAVAMRHHSMLPNHGGLPQGPTHAGMVPAHFPYSGAIPPAHMATPAFAAIQQHSLPPGHPPTPGPDPFFSAPSILNHHIYK